ncbi:MAG: hypothetical protein P8107_08605 [Spirochaetia bacterium]
MKSNHNEIAEGFLARYGLGEKNSTVFLPLQKGYLKLEYGRFDREDALSIVSFVRHNSEDARAVGRLLKLRLFPGGNGDKGTFIAENAVSGLQWAHGKAWSRHTGRQGPSREILQ